MKDLPHHIKKLNRRIIRSMHKEELAEDQLPEVPTWPETERQKKKKAKIKRKSAKEARPSSDLTPDQQNKVMKKGRVPVFDRTNNAKPKHARSSKKKTPRI